MAGYARQSSSSIADGETITAAPLNSEFDAVLAAFAFSGGHNHDGSSTEGAYVGILADVDALNKIVVDNTNNRHGFFVEVSSSAVEQIRIQDGAIVPVTSNDIDLGTSSLQYKDIHIDGTAYVDTLEIHVGASLSAGVLSLPDGSASAPVITNTGDTNQGLYFSGTDEMSFTAGGTAQVTFADGVIKPVTDNDVDLGTSSLQFKDIHINGTANIDTLAGTTMSGNLAMGSNLITGLAAPSSDGDAARKVYVDDAITNASNLTQLGGIINVNGYHFTGSSGEDIKFKPVGSASILSTQDTDGEFVALVLRNESDAADTTGIASLRFDLEDTGGNTVDAAKIAVKKEASFTATAATQDSSMVFSTSLNGTLTEYLKLTSAGILEPITDNTVDIGTSAKQIKDMYVHGTAYLDAIGFGTTSITLPTADGSANQILKTNGSGTLSFADDTGTTINNATENELVTVSSTTTQLDGEANLTFDGTTLTLNGKLAMASNTAGKLLIADGTDFEPTAVGDLSEISSVASDDVLIAVDTSGGGLKKITRANLVSGLATSSAISNVVEDTTPQLGGDLDAQGKDITDVGILSADASAGIYGATGSPVVFTVTVASKTSAHPYNGDGSSSGYFLNGVESPALKLHGADSVTSSSGYYYKFDQAEGTNSGHPLRFYLDAAKTIAYTTGVTTSGTPGTAGAHTTIAVTDQTPSTLYYQCSSHSYMGNYASVDSANITSSGAVSIDAVGDVTIDADGGDIIFKDAGTTFGSATNTSGDLILKSGTTTALTFDGANATVAGNLVVTGNHTVNGTTTTVNSTTVTIDDPIFTLGGDGTPGSDDNKDRGIEFKYHTGSAAKVGFFGWDDSAGAFTFVPDATNSSEVFSGTVGNAIFGNITGTLQTAAQTNITSVGALDGGSITSGFGAIDNGTSGIRTNTFTAETSVVPDSSGGADLGSTSLEWGDLYIADDKKIYLGSDQNFSIEYDEDGNDTTAVVAAGGVSLAPHGTSTGNGTELRFQELAANGANYVGFKSPDAIASNEVWVLPNADGSDGQVFKTDGSNALSWADAGGGGTVDKVADGDIAIRKPVVLTAAGKAKQIAETTTESTNTSPTVKAVTDIDGTGGDRAQGAWTQSTYEATSGTYVYVFSDTSNSNYCTVIAGTWSNGTVSWGTPTAISGNSIDSYPVITSGDGRVYVLFRYTGSGNIYLYVGTISGTTFTEKSNGAIQSDAADGAGLKIEYSPTQDQIFMIYSRTNSGSKTYARSASINANGTVNTISSELQLEATNAHADRGSLTYDSDTDRAMYATFNGAQGDDGYAWVLQAGGTAGSPTIAAGTGTKWNGTDNVNYVSGCYDTENNKTFLAFRDGGGTVRGVIASINSGTNAVTFAGEADIWDCNDSGGNYFEVAFDEDTNKIIFVYRDDDNSDYATYKIITPGASSFSVADGAAINSSDIRVFTGTGSGAAGKGVLFSIGDAGDSNKIAYTTSFFGTTSSTTSTIGDGDYLGISAAAISDGATGKIVIPGGISEGHSSLTIGSRLFTNGAGAIGLAGNARGFEFLGKAISATEIQLQDREFEFYAEADGAVTKGAPIDVASGKIKNIVGNSIGVGSVTTLSGTNTTQQLDSVYDTGSDRTVVSYKDKGNSNYGTAVVLQSGTDSVTAGTPVVFHSGSTTTAAYQSPNSIVYDPDTDRIIILFVGPNDYLYSVVGSITAGTNASSWGSVQTIDSSKSYQSPAISYDLGVDRALIMGRQQSNGGALAYWVGTVNGGTTNNITLGNEAYILSTSGGGRIFGVLYDTTNNKHIINYSDFGNSSVRFKVATVTGGTTNTTAFATTDAFAGGSGGYDNVRNGCISFDPDRTTSGETVFAYVWSASNDSNKTQAARINVTSTGGSAGTLRQSTIIEPGHDDLPQGYGGMDLTYDTSTDTHVYTAGNSDGLKLAAFTLTGDGGVTGAITVSGFTDNVMTAAAQTAGATLAFDSDTNKMILSYQDEDNDYAKARMITSPAVDSTKTNFDGFAQYAAADGNIVAAKLDYSIDTNQSGLTAGSTYYLDSETALVTSSSGNQKVGVALTATDLQIVKT